MRYKTKNQRCLGIDPGIGNTGWGIVKRSPTGYQLLRSGVIYTASDAPTAKRFDTIYTRLVELLTKRKPDLVSIEGVFFNRNVSSAMSTAGVIAIAQLACEHAGIPSVVIKPQVVKASVTGTGTASKEQVKKMVNRLLGAGIRNDHEADAIAAAIGGLLKICSVPVLGA